MRTWLRSHPVLGFYGLAFAISWGGTLLVVGPGNIPGQSEDFARLLPGVVLAVVAGPSVAGIVCTALVDGRPGLRALWARTLAWSVGARWIVLAVLTAPLTVTATLGALSLTSPAYLPGIVTTPHPLSHVLAGLLTGLVAGLFEEIGWTGFAIPRLRARLSIAASGVVVGLLWGAWHALPIWWGSTDTLGDVPAAWYLPAMLFSFLPPFRVLMVWVHDRTGASLGVAMLMHASLTASVRIFDPLSIAGWPLVIYNVALGVVLWLIVVVAWIATRARAAQRPVASGRRESG